MRLSEECFPFRFYSAGINGLISGLHGSVTSLFAETEEGGNM
jgi:hypothetical protein